MQLAFDAADRLCDLVQARRGSVPAADAARTLFALASAPTAIARSLLDDVVAGDARLTWRGDNVGLADPPGARTPLEEAEFVVIDLETTGLTPSSAHICEIGAQRVRSLELAETFETLVDPRVPLPPVVQTLTGIRPSAVRGAPRIEAAMRRLLVFAGEAPIVAHNARFDLAFLDRELEKLTGRRIASPVVDTVWLARRLLGDRTRRVGLAALAHFFGTNVEPCHRALPDATATAEILIRLIGLAQERGARTVADLVELAAPRARRLHAKRSLAATAPPRPGIYMFRDSHDQVLYVGRARDLRARLRSYFSGTRQRPSVEAALAAVERIEWDEHGSELEAALTELQLLRELRPPANVRGTRPDLQVYLHRREHRWIVSSDPSPHGPLRSRRVARRAAQLLEGFDGDDPGSALPAARERLRRLACSQRFEDAARLRDRIGSLEEVTSVLAELARLRAWRACVLVPAREPGYVRAFFVASGCIAAVRTVPRGGGARLEIAAALAAATAALPARDAEAADELRVVASFLRRPPPELHVVGLEHDAIERAIQGIALAA